MFSRNENVLRHAAVVNLAKGKTVTVDGMVWSDLTNGDINSPAFIGASGQRAAFELDLETTSTFNEIWLYESGGLNVKEFSIYIEKQDEWILLYKQDEIGPKRVCSFPPVTAQRIKIEITEACASYTLNEIEVVNAVGREGTGDFRVVSYFTGWAEFTKYGPEKMPEFFDVSTDLIYIGDVCWDADSNLRYGTYVAKDEAEYAEKVANTKACITACGKNIRLWATVNPLGGLSGVDILQSLQGEKLNKLIQNLVEHALKYGFDGLDFDWEYPEGEEQWAAYSSFMVNLKKELNKHGLLLSTTNRPYDVQLTPEAIEAVDYIQTMWYFGTAWDRHPHTNYRNAVDAIEYCKSIGFKPEKIVVGMAFYASDGGAGEIPYSQVIPNGITRWDNVWDNWMFNGCQSVRDKVVMAINKNVSGMMTWHLTCDAEKSVCGMSLYDEVAQVKKQYLGQ